MASGLENIETIESPFRRFVTTIGVFPTAFTDAMTYYECLAYLVKYLEETVIPAVNENAEALKELQKYYIQLKSYVDNYFANLDVQDEINNKLDQMASDGTLQEIITTYIQSNVAWTFDTVADMKLATNLVAGSYAQTLGFHSLNDGGGAIYKITDSGSTNEMDVIAVGDLYANLVYGKEINVKQLGAYGDDTHSDSDIFTRAQVIAQSNGVVLYAPKAVYLLSTAVNLKHIIVKCEGELNNTETLVLGAYSNASTTTDVHIYKCKNVQIEGAKNSYFNIDHASNITLFADGNDSSNTSIAYNKIEGIECNDITISNANGGWINENEFNIKRGKGDLTIGGDGSYIHNNNRFNNICIEGATKHITINYGHHNYITYRGEGSPIISVNSEPTNSFANVISKTYTSNHNSLIGLTDINANKTANFIGSDYYPTCEAKELININKYSVKHINTNLYVNVDDQVIGNWATEYINNNIPSDLPFTIILHASSACQRMYVNCYDENNAVIDGNVGGAGIIQNPTTKEYYTSNNTANVVCNFFPSSTVKRVSVKISAGSAGAFDWVVAKIYTPFVNLSQYDNEVDTTKKYMNASPATVTTLNQTWAKGDIVYNSNPTAGGNVGWVCTVAGTPGTWKAFGTIEA